MKKAILLLLFVFSAQLEAQEIEPFHILFEVGNDNLTVANTELEFNRQGDSWQIRSSTKASGIFAWFNKDEVIEISTVRFHNGRYWPNLYQYISKTPKKTDTRSFEFDYQHNTITRNIDGQAKQQELAENSYDPTSLILAVAMMVKQQGADSSSTQVNFQDHRRVSTIDYQVGKSEKLHLPWGEVNAIKVSQQQSPEPVKTSVWIAPELGFIPVKIEQRKDGELVAHMKLKKRF